MDSPGRRSRLPACSSNSLQLTLGTLPFALFPAHALHSHATCPSSVMVPAHRHPNQCVILQALHQLWGCW